MNRLKATKKRSGVIAATALIAVLASPLASSAGRDSPPTIGNTHIECTTTMEIANVDCLAGATAALGLAHRTTGQRAPWCGAEEDLTIYGCAGQAVPATSAFGSE